MQRELGHYLHHFRVAVQQIQKTQQLKQATGTQKPALSDPDGAFSQSNSAWKSTFISYRVRKARSNPRMSAKSSQSGVESEERTQQRMLARHRQEETTQKRNMFALGYKDALSQWVI